jgi:hypothetical protein
VSEQERPDLSPEKVRTEATTMVLALVEMGISTKSAVEMLGHASGLMIGMVAARQGADLAWGLVKDFERGKQAGLANAKTFKIEAL